MTNDQPATQRTAPPFTVFRFAVTFGPDSLGSSDSSDASIPICGAAFSECSGIEATMEPKVIEQGGQNYGAAQRVGHVSFATVILKRGMTSTRHLFDWFQHVTLSGGSATRYRATIAMQDASGNEVLRWVLHKALPIKFKAADLNALGNDIAIEELHLAHEGLTVEPPAAASSGDDGGSSTGTES